MRLIDALAAKKAVFNHNLSSRKEKAALLKLLDGLPEINPIHAAGGCYCNECKHFEPCEEIDGESWTGFCKYGNFHTDVVDFCSRGRRRENAKCSQ